MELWTTNLIRILVECTTGHLKRTFGEVSSILCIVYNSWWPFMRKYGIRRSFGFGLLPHSLLHARARWVHGASTSHTHPSMPRGRFWVHSLLSPLMPDPPPGVARHLIDQSLGSLCITTTHDSHPACIIGGVSVNAHKVGGPLWTKGRQRCSRHPREAEDRAGALEFISFSFHSVSIQ